MARKECSCLFCCCCCFLSQLIYLFCSVLFSTQDLLATIVQYSVFRTEVYVVLTVTAKMSTAYRTECADLVEGKTKNRQNQFHKLFSCFVNTYLVSEGKMYIAVHMFFNAHAKAVIFQTACNCMQQKNPNVISSSLLSPMQEGTEGALS